MCGIAGIFHFDATRKADANALRRMTDSLFHRGPDGEGFYINGNVGLGHRRLSIIDLQTGSQPMYSEDLSIVLVFNGEIYNYIELREELKGLGHQFSTSSDTEVIIKAYQQWGPDCQARFNGMWAFALWDANQQRLFLSRDRIGEKPLYYTIVDNTIVFGSEIKSLFAAGVPEEYNHHLLEIYLTLSFIPAPHTFFKGIYKLEAGHYFLVTGHCVKKLQFWDLPSIDEANMNCDRKAIYEQFDNLLTDSVRLRMRSDVPYGAFLSGGLDSSSIVSVMAQISSFPVETFTVGYKERNFDERYLARIVAKKFHTNHHEVLVESDSLTESLNNVAMFFDEPFGDSSAIGTRHVSKFASSKVKMVLTGDGGDEVLSGYTNYQGEKFAAGYQNLPAWMRRSIPRFLSLLSKSFAKDSVPYALRRMQNVCYSSDMDFKARYISKMLCIDMDVIKQIANNKETYPVEDFVSDCLKKCDYKDPFYQLMYLNYKLTLPDDMLVKTDRMSMAHSLETRIPFLDYRLIEFMVRVHKNIKMKNLERKSILRNTIGKNLPRPILTAPKRGFSVPLRYWFKDASVQLTFENLENEIDFLNEHGFNAILKMNTTGRHDDGNFIWKLFVLNKVISKPMLHSTILFSTLLSAI